MRSEQLRAAARNTRLARNQVPVELLRAIEKAQWMRLEFSGGIVVDLPRRDYEALRDSQDWMVEFPPESLRVL